MYWQTKPILKNKFIKMSRNFCIEIDICNVPTQMQANLIVRTGKLSSKIDQLPLLESSTLFRATALHALIQ